MDYSNVITVYNEMTNAVFDIASMHKERYPTYMQKYTYTWGDFGYIYKMTPILSEVPDVIWPKFVDFMYENTTNLTQIQKMILDAQRMWITNPIEVDNMNTNVIVQDCAATHHVSEAVADISSIMNYIDGDGNFQPKQLNANKDFKQYEPVGIYIGIPTQNPIETIVQTHYAITLYTDTSNNIEYSVDAHDYINDHIFKLGYMNDPIGGTNQTHLNIICFQL